MRKSQILKGLGITQLCGGSGTLTGGARSRGRSPLLCEHAKRHHSFSSLYRKAKDTILITEARSGPLVRTCSGIAQAVGTAAVVFGTGYGVTTLIDHINPKSSPTPTYFAVQTLEDEQTEMASKMKLSTTYLHLGSGLLVSGLTAALSFRIFRNKEFLFRLANRPIAILGFGVVTPFAMSYIVHRLPFTESDKGKVVQFGLKEMGHLLYAGSIGLFAAPLYLLGGSSMIRAGCIASGACAGLHGVAYFSAPEVTLNWDRPLAVANHIVIASFILTLLLHRNHFAFSTLYRVMMHGGILVYSAHFVHALQSMHLAAKSPSYDPVNSAMNLSMDLLNIYARLAFLLPPHYKLSRQHLFIQFKDKPATIITVGRRPNPTNGSKDMTPRKDDYD